MIAGAVKSSRLFSLQKKVEATPSARVLVAGSSEDDTDTDDDEPIYKLTKKLSFNKPDKTIIAASDDELPSPSTKLLSISKIQRVNTWLSSVPKKGRDSIDSLLDSGDEEDRADITEDIREAIIRQICAGFHY